MINVRLLLFSSDSFVVRSIFSIFLLDGIKGGLERHKSVCRGVSWTQDPVCFQDLQKMHWGSPGRLHGVSFEQTASVGSCWIAWIQCIGTVWYGSVLCFPNQPLDNWFCVWMVENSSLLQFQDLLCCTKQLGRWAADSKPETVCFHFLTAAEFLLLAL